MLSIFLHELKLMQVTHQSKFSNEEKSVQRAIQKMSKWEKDRIVMYIWESNKRFII